MIELVNRETGELLDVDSIPGLAEVAALHHDAIESLATAIDELKAGEQSSAGVRRPVVWADLEPHEARRTWRRLAGWVGWLRSRYPLAQRIPPCWWRHPELVEELTALWQAWMDSYVVKGAPLGAGADWHGRVLPELLRRMGNGGWNIPCESEHRPVVQGLYDERGVDDTEAFQAHLSRIRGDNDTESEGTQMDDAQLQALINTGEAVRLGDLPGSPVVLDNEYWRPVDTGGWEIVRDPELIAYLADARHRLEMADAAIAATEHAS